MRLIPILILIRYTTASVISMRIIRPSFAASRVLSACCQRVHHANKKPPSRTTCVMRSAIGGFAVDPAVDPAGPFHPAGMTKQALCQSLIIANFAEKQGYFSLADEMDMRWCVITCNEFAQRCQSMHKDCPGCCHCIVAPPINGSLRHRTIECRKPFNLLQ